MDFKYFDTLVIDSGLNSTCCLTWSDDNKFSVIAEDGLHIYELSPLSSDIFSSSLVHSWIPGDSASQFSLFDNQLNNLLWTFDRKQLCKMATDTFNPTGVKSLANKSRIIQSCFSPSINGESYVSCLKENGSLDVYKIGINVWAPIINVLKEWTECRPSAEAQSSLNLDYFKARIMQFKIVTHAWSAKQGQVYLITGHQDGTVCIWLFDKGTLKIIPEVFFQVNGIPCVVAMERFADYLLLFVGVCSGKVKLFVLSNFSPLNETEIWKENDLIASNQIKVHNVDNVLYVLVAKHDILVIQEISISGKAVEIVRLKWFEFSSPIVGVCCLGNDFLVGLHGQEFFKVSDFSVKRLDISFLTKGETDVHCYGIAPSRNSSIWIVASSSKISSGNKSAKNYPRLKFFSCFPVKYKFWSDFSAKGLVEKLMKADALDIKLTEISDILELKKLELLADPSLFQLACSAEKDSTPLRLKLELWEVRLKSLCCSAELSDVAHRLEFLLGQKKMETVGYNKAQDCCICHESTNLKNFKVSNCAKSHQFPLCCISFSPCNKTPYAFCRFCNSVALIELVSHQENRCLYCDALLTADNRVLPRIP